MKCPREDSCLNEKLEYDKSTIEEKISDAKPVVGVCLPKSNQIASKNIVQHYTEGNLKIFSECKIRKYDLNRNIRTLFKYSYGYQ